LGAHVAEGLDEGTADLQTSSTSAPHPDLPVAATRFHSFVDKGDWQSLRPLSFKYKLTRSWKTARRIFAAALFSHSALSFSPATGNLYYNLPWIGIRIPQVFRLLLPLFFIYSSFFFHFFLFFFYQATFHESTRFQLYRSQTLA
jgi:hypothetical protein